MSWVTIRSIGTPRGARGGAGVSATLLLQMRQLENLLVQSVREEAPVNKNPNAPNRGALRQSIRGSLQTEGTRFRIALSALSYIQYVVNDTRPHRIAPKRPGGMLAFEWNGQSGLSTSLGVVSHLTSGGAAGSLGHRGGRSIFTAPSGHAQLAGNTVFLRFVNHPGTKANEFVKRGLERAMAVQLPIMTSAVSAAIADEIVALMPQR